MSNFAFKNQKVFCEMKMSHCRKSLFNSTRKLINYHSNLHMKMTKIITYLFVPTLGRIERWEMWAFFLLITEGAMFFSCLIPTGFKEGIVLCFLLLYHLCSMFTGILPISIFFVLYSTWVAPQYDIWLLPFVLFCDLTLYIYIVQCIKRCRDLGKAWWWAFIPIFNPYWLLFKK